MGEAILKNGEGVGGVPYQSYQSILNPQQLGQTGQWGSRGQPLRRRVYIAVQLPQREIEVTKLYEDNAY